MLDTSQAVQASEDALALLALMVALDPGRRISVEDALAHPYFRCSTPGPSSSQSPDLLLPPACFCSQAVHSCGLISERHLQGRPQAHTARAAAQAPCASPQPPEPIVQGEYRTCAPFICRRRAAALSGSTSRTVRVKLSEIAGGLGARLLKSSMPDPLCPQMLLG